MTPAFDPLNIFLLAVAIFIFWWLKSVLGRRTGNERPPFDPVIVKPKPDALPRTAETIDVPARSAPESNKPVWEGHAPEGSGVAAGLSAISAASSGFDPDQFVAGARRAYEMILEAYANGDKQALRPLLGREVAETFNSAIDRRIADGGRITFQFVGVKSSVFERARLDGNKAQLTVKFRSEMIHATLDKDGNTLAGDPKAVREVEDIWTFERDVSTSDPNWKLVSTDDSIG